MIGGAWLLWKRRKKATPTPALRELALASERLPYGFHSTLQNFLARYHPGIRLLLDMDGTLVQVVLPEEPARVAAEIAVDAAYERNRLGAA